MQKAAKHRICSDIQPLLIKNGMANYKTSDK